MPKLVLLAGIPGSGKSTWAETFCGGKYAVVNPDTIRIREFGSMAAAYEGDVKANNEHVFGLFHRRISDALHHGVDVVADATNLHTESRQQVRTLAHAIPGVSMHLVLFMNTHQAMHRNASRPDGDRVPPEAQDRMVDGYRNLLGDLLDGENGLYDTITKIKDFA